MIGEKIMPDIILVSGGFDPIHSGHIKLINEANKYGDVVVLLNSDQWLRNKKGKEFLPFGERKIIMQNLKGVLDVIEFWQEMPYRVHDRIIYTNTDNVWVTKKLYP